MTKTFQIAAVLVAFTMFPVVSASSAPQFTCTDASHRVCTFNSDGSRDCMCVSHDRQGKFRVTQFNARSIGNGGNDSNHSYTASIGKGPGGNGGNGDIGKGGNGGNGDVGKDRRQRTWADRRHRAVAPAAPAAATPVLRWETPATASSSAMPAKIPRARAWDRQGGGARSIELQ